jgi:WD40 repeat protein
VEVFHARGGRLVRDHALPFPTPGPTDVAVGLGRDGFLRLRQSGTASMLEQEVDPRLAQRPVGRIVAAPLAGLYRTAFSADRSRLATWPAGGTSVTVWRLPEGAEVATLPSRVAVQAAGFARDSTLVVLGGSSRSHLLEVWSLPERQLVSAVQGEAGESAVRSLAVDPAGGFLIAGGTDFALSAWALPELAPLWRVEPRACCPGDFLELSPDGSVVVTGSGSGLLFLDARSGRLLKKLTTNHGRGIRAAAFHPDGRSLATVGYDSALALWDVRRILGEAE